MRILLAGDTHGGLVRCQMLALKAYREFNCDRVFVLGDFGYWEHTKDGEDFLNKLDFFCNVRGTRIYFLDGNHDKTSLLLKKYDDDEHRDPEGFLRLRPHIFYARRGHRWTWGGVRFIALGGAYSVDKDRRLQREKKDSMPESQWFPEEEMSDEDMLGFLQNTDPVEVMLAHDKPRGSSPGWNRKAFDECFPNQNRLQHAINVLNPVLFFHGHLHFYYTERMEHSVVGRDAPSVTTVIGLDSSRDASNGPPGDYRPDHSWYVLDTDAVIKQKWLD